MKKFQTPYFPRNNISDPLFSKFDKLSQGEGIEPGKPYLTSYTYAGHIVYSRLLQKIYISNHTKDITTRFFIRNEEFQG